MRTNENEKKGITGFTMLLILVAVICAGYFLKKQYTSYRHPYKDIGIIGTWNYDYSVTFDEKEDWKRADEDRYNADLYIDAEIVFNDDGTFKLAMDEIIYEGTWVPDDKVSNLFILTPESSEYNQVIDYNEVRWDKTDDKLFVGISKDTVPPVLDDLFQDEEVYRDVFFKIDRPKEKIVYRSNNDYQDYDEWDDDGDNGLPFNYHP